MKYTKSIFLFTRDLRLEDNTGLIEALQNSETVIPVFIFNPKQIKNNKFKSEHSIKFMCESIDDLNLALKKCNSKLFCFYGDPVTVLKKLLVDKSIQAIYMNHDYTPFAKSRENDIKELKIESHFFHDYLLTDHTVFKQDGTIYVKYTPFLNAAHKHIVRNVTKNTKKNYITNKHKFVGEIDNIHKFYKVKNDYTPYIKGGRTEIINMMKTFGKHDDYNNSRNFPNKQTTMLSAYLKFNIVSVREVFYLFKKFFTNENTLFDQLYWRDFYMYIVDANPHVIGGPMKKNFYPKWIKNNVFLEKWQTGITGFPIVDAGMRQLNKTGWMHNRVRMIVADFLIKLLHIDWMYGEKYFATQLIDYDVAVNNGNWQWMAYTGTSSQLTVFNPWLQQHKFDKDCLYIKTWIPELKNVENHDIHNWYDVYKNYDNYCAPIVDYNKEKIVAINYYKNKK
jgi:deoxyribodipyrimidine photo-lyase